MFLIFLLLKKTSIEAKHKQCVQNQHKQCVRKNEMKINLTALNALN